MMHYPHRIYQIYPFLFVFDSKCVWNSDICVFNYCAVLWCAQIIEYIMVWWQYTVICTLHYLIIIIMQTYLKLLNC